MTTPAVTITARRPSRWRCGVEHTAEAVPYEAGHWTEEQLEALRADPELVVSEGHVAPAVEAGGIPTTPTVEAALDTALSALRRATPDQVRGFLEAMEEDPDIRAQVEAAIAARAAADGEKGDAEPTRVERLTAAIDELEEGNKEHWTEDGKPDTFALRKASGLGDASAAERDEAFEAWKIAAGKDLTGG